MKLQLNIAIDGTVTGNVISEIIAPPIPTPTPIPAAPVLPTDFGPGSIDDQVKVLLQWQFDHSEWSPQILIDGNPYGQPGQYPAARFTTAGGKLRLESLLQAAADAGLSGGQFVAVREAIKAAAVDPTRLWETTPSTLDPASMSFLLVWQGGPNALEKAKAYRVTYYKRYGKQCMLPDAPRNPEAAWITDAELAQIIAS